VIDVNEGNRCERAGSSKREHDCFTGSRGLGRKGGLSLEKGVTRTTLVKTPFVDLIDNLDLSQSFCLPKEDRGD
jgi:hypothetical protein